MNGAEETFWARRLQLVREADGPDEYAPEHHYCPPLQAPMSVHIRHASPHGITDENAPRVLRAIFEDDAERQDFGAALAAWACIMGAFIGLAYAAPWVARLIFGGA